MKVAAFLSFPSLQAAIYSRLICELLITVTQNDLPLAHADADATFASYTVLAMQKPEVLL